MTPEQRQYCRGQLWAGVLAFIVLALLLVTAKVVRGDDFPPGEDQIVPLVQGERAPFDGQLFETTTAIRWGFRLESLRLRLDADVAAAVESCAVTTELLHTKLQLSQERYDFNTSLLQGERDRLRSQVVELTQAVAAASDDPWYETVWFGISVGVVLSALLGVGAAYLAGAV